MEITAVGLGVTLMAASVPAQQPAAPDGGPAAGQLAPGATHHGGMPHDGMHGDATATDSAALPASPGQDAFGAIAEVVRILDADPRTDWTRVDLERLRRHLIDMSEVVLHAEVAGRAMPAGLAMAVTGAGRTERAIRAMVIPHAAELDRLPGLSARAEPIPGGVQLTVVARDPADATAVTRVRGLGFIGLLTLGAHHQRHHLAIARGDAMGVH